jgi:hypothetical protein
LQQDLELLHDVVRRAFVEALGAIAALQQEGIAALRLGELRFEVLDLPGRHDRRQVAQLREHAFQVAPVAVRGLLGSVPALPARWVPIRWNVGLGHVLAGAVRNAGTIPPLLRRPKKRPTTARNAASPHTPADVRSRIEERAPMPLAVALLCHPIGTFTALLAAIVAALYAAQSRRFLPAFTAVSAALLALLAFLQVPPSAAGLTWLFVGVALLHAEFLCPTFGVAGMLGFGSAAWGSCLLLAQLSPLARGAAALLGALLLLAAVARTMRLRTLPP